MPADLVPHAAIPDRAARVTPDMLKILRRIQEADFIMNGKDVDPATADILRQLTELGLIDTGSQGDTSGPPYMWVSNGNGSRVLSYLSIRGGPHYEIPAFELAAWLEDQGKDRWWNVDGDPLLTGRMTFPCPARDLAGELRKINRPLLVQANKDDTGAKGQTIGKKKLNELVGHFPENSDVLGEGQTPALSGDRLLYLCWKERSYVWLLVEDSEATAQMQLQGDETTKAN
jgi:hypothetical protein